MQRILVTGGAGFIGSHVTDRLLADGYSVRILDILSPQVHPTQTVPDYLNREAELIVGDVRDEEAVTNALRGVDAVIHLASVVGVGQSMYEIAHYVDHNERGTAVLLQCLSRQPVQRLICASSMSIYGEGSARRADGAIVVPGERPVEQLRRGVWELSDTDGGPLTPIKTAESKPPALSSVYALNKYAQERMSLIVGQAYGIPTTALRFFNAYGPRQALSNPYTGVLAIFASRIMQDRPPLVYEDGRQMRDFVHVEDVAAACVAALQSKDTGQAVYNVASGVPRTVLSVAEDLARVMGRSQMSANVVGKYRAGDIRHCFADIGGIEQGLGFKPRVSFDDGLQNLVEWLAGQQAVDRVDQATAELERRGLVA